MNSVSFPIFILFLAVVYLFAVYGLLTIAQMFKPENNIISANSEDSNNQVEIT